MVVNKKKSDTAPFDNCCFKAKPKTELSQLGFFDNTKKFKPSNQLRFGIFVFFFNFCTTS